MTLANGLMNGNILSATPTPLEPATPVDTAPAREPAAVGQSLDQLELQINALRQQALGTQTAIKQLDAQEMSGFHTGLLSDAPWAIGLAEVFLGVAALIFGSAVVWALLRRRLVAPAPVKVDFLDSRQYLNAQDQEPLPVARTPQKTSANLDLSEPLALRSAPPVADFQLSAPMVESDSILNMDWGPAGALSASSVDFDISTLGSEGDDSDALVAQRAVAQFDPQVAASEVERVRKSLADKRDARTRLREYERSVRVSQPQQKHQPYNQGVVDLQQLQDQAADTSGQDGIAEPSDDALDLALDMDLDVGGAPVPELMGLDLDLGIGAPAEMQEPTASFGFTTDVKDEEAPMASFNFTPGVRDEVEPMASFNFTPGVKDEAEPTASFEAAPDVTHSHSAESSAELLTSTLLVNSISLARPDADAETYVGPDGAVQLALALEFQSLGMLDGARELCLELVESSNAEIKAQANRLLAVFDAQLTAQRVGELFDSQN